MLMIDLNKVSGLQPRETKVLQAEARVRGRQRASTAHARRAPDREGRARGRGGVCTATPEGSWADVKPQTRKARGLFME